MVKAHMTGKIAKTAERAEGLLFARYWRACDAAERAIDPAEIDDLPTWAEDLLAVAYASALDAEADVLGWQEGRAKIG